MSNKPLHAVVEFIYQHPQLGTLSVEALFTVQEADTSERDSDIDYNGFKTLDHVDVFKGREQVFVDIPEDVLYHHLREYLRNIEIAGCFLEEGEI